MKKLLMTVMALSCFAFSSYGQKKPEKVIELAVKGMLPKGPMGRDMIKKLHVYAGPEHANQAQKPEVLTF